MLTNDIFIKSVLDLHRRRKLTIIRFVFTFLEFFSNYIVAKLYALVADIDGRPSDQLSNFMLTLTAEITVE
jgi:hypothetical protein